MSGRRSQGEGTIFKDASGRWIGMLDLGRDAAGKRQRRKVTGRTKAEVSRRLAELRDAQRDGQQVARRAPTVGELAAEWLTKVAPARREESTMSRVQARIEGHLIANIGAVRVDQLDEPMIERWLQAEADDGRSLRTIQDYRGDLRQLLNWALRRRLVARNVATTAELPLNAKESAPKRSYTWEQLDALYTALDAAEGRQRDRLRAYFVVVCELGLRPGEADALRWADIDLKRRVLHVRAAMKRSSGGAPIDVGEPKTPGSKRSLRLTDVAIEALRHRRADQLAERIAYAQVWTADRRWADLVFTSEIGTPLHPSNVRRSFASACKRAGVPKLTPYELRHTRASLLVDGGAAPHRVADQLGHVDTRMLDRHYRHRVAEVIDTAADLERQRRRA